MQLATPKKQLLVTKWTFSTSQHSTALWYKFQKYSHFDLKWFNKVVMGKFIFVTILCCLRKAHYKGHQFLTQMLKGSSKPSIFRLYPSTNHLNYWFCTWFHKVHNPSLYLICIFQYNFVYIERYDFQMLETKLKK